MGAIYSFGDWELDEPLFELRRAGKRVAVQPKVLRFLLLLAEHHERVVPHDEILAVLWPNESVTPASIRRAVRAARRALGDGAESQATIATVRSRGYRFVQDVQSRPPASSVRVRSSPSDPFVGRAALLARVDADLTAVVAGKSRTLWLSGVPGIGKSRALEEIGERCRLEGFEVLFGRCLEAEGAPAFWPWFQMLRHCLLGRGVESFRELLGANAASLAEGVPELREWIAGVPVTPRIDSAEARFRFFESIALFLERASARSPLAVLIDDLTRADAPSLRLLSFAVQHIRDCRVLVVGTLRAPSGASGAFADVLSDLVRQDPSALSELKEFSRDEVASYFEACGGAALSPDTASALFDRTAGNPLYCRQLLELSRASGAPLGDASVLQAGGVRHQGLHRAIERHLDVVSAECRRALRVAAVFGREFSGAVLAAVLEVNQGRAESHIDEALRAGLAARVGGVERFARFQHSLVRDVLYDEIPQEERPPLHARAGDALEASRGAPADVSAAVLAHHFFEALPFRNDGKALEYSRAAAVEASLCLAYEEAVRHFDRALGIVGTAEGSRGERLWLLMGKGEVLSSGLDAMLARRTLLDAAALAEQLGCTESLARIAVAFARSPEPAEVDRERVSLFERALARLPETDERYPVVQALLSRSLLYAGEFEERQRLSHAALAAAHRFANPAVLGQTLRLVHEALAEPQHLPLRRRFSDELVRVARACSDAELSIHAAVTQVQDFLELGDLGRVGDAIRSLEGPSGVEKRPLARFLAHVFSSTRAEIAGEFDVAQKHADAALAMGLLVGEEFALHIYCVQVSGFWRLIGRSAEAYELVRRITERYPALSGWRAFLAGIDAELGRRDRAERELARLMEDVASLRCEPYSMSALCPIAELCTFVGTPAQARTVYEILLPFESLHGVVSFGMATHGPVARHLGMLAHRMGDSAAAERHFEAALAIAEAMPSPTFAALTCVSHARLLARSEGAALARRSALLRKALAIAERTGMAPLAELCRYYLQAHQPAGLSAARAR